MQQWEYFSTFLEADIRKVTPGIAGVPSGEHAQHSPYSLIPELNAFGAEGWELITAEPLLAGRKEDFVQPAGDAGRWGYHYLCVFKRPLS